MISLFGHERVDAREQVADGAVYGQIGRERDEEEEEREHREEEVVGELCRAVGRGVVGDAAVEELAEPSALMSGICATRKT